VAGGCESAGCSFATLFSMTYIAFLRGIMPMNPNMHPKKLKEAFEKMGFKNVRTVISSGNVVFESASKNSAQLEKKVETALPKLLGFNSATIIRSKDELEALIKKNPAKGITHGTKTYVLVTFLKNHSAKLRTMERKGPGYKVLGVYKREVCFVIDMQHSRTPELMQKAEKEFGKEITSRTWKTVERIASKMS
jgi:uncharacterized protein (DUF1697 family)